jgi:hypothetical protein
MMIDVEMKDWSTTATFDALRSEIRSVLSLADLITPDAAHRPQPRSRGSDGR